MHMRVEIDYGWNPERPYRLQITTPPMQGKDLDDSIFMAMSEAQLIALRDGINEFLGIKDYIPNTGSAFQQELDK